MFILIIDSFRDSKSIVQAFFWVGAIFLVSALSFFIFFYVEEISVVLVLQFSFLLLAFFLRSHAQIPFLYTVGVFFAVGLWIYWDSMYGVGYYLGKKTDDWFFDVYWTSGFVEKYGLNPIYIKDHLNDISPSLGELHNSIGYVYLISLIRYFSEFFGGYHTLISIIFNFTFLGFSLYALSSSLRRCYKKNFNLIFFLIFLYPTVLTVSSHVFRDAIVMGLLVLLFSYLIDYKYDYAGRLKFFFASFVILLIIFFFRMSVVPIALVCIFLSFVSFSYRSIAFAFTVAVLASPWVIIFFGDELSRLYSGYYEFNLERTSGLVQRIFELPIYFGWVPRFIYLFYVPSPSLSNGYQLFSSLAVPLQLFAAPGLIKSVFSDKVPGEIKAFFLVIAFSVIVSTMTFRHVLMFLPFGVILWVFGYKFRIFEVNFRYVVNVFVFVLFSMSLLALFSFI